MLRRDLQAPAFVFVVGLATILAAWGFQIIGHYVPCGLCLQERIPYYVGVPLALVALIAAYLHSPAWFVKLALALAGIVFLYGAYLGAFHAGAEWAWWPGPSDCGTGAGPASTAGDLLGSLDGIHIVSCTEASWRLLGLSFAGWNAVASIVLAAVAAFGVMRKNV